MKMLSMKGGRLVVLAGALLAGALVVSGCVAPPPPPPPMDTRVTVAPELCGRAWVTDVRLARGASQHYTVQANVVNGDRGICRLAYRVVWLDAGGVEIPTVLSTWQPASLSGMEIRGLTATAPSTEAVDFRLYLKGDR